jgi:hypothetical protein
MELCNTTALTVVDLLSALGVLVQKNRDALVRVPEISELRGDYLRYAIGHAQARHVIPACAGELSR